jgi:hypothetical protein
MDPVKVAAELGPRLAACGTIVVMSGQLTVLWHMADAAKPDGWELMGLRCTSAVLATDPLSDRWVAEACGPADGCIRVESHSAEDALQLLNARLRGLPNI